MLSVVLKVACFIALGAAAAVNAQDFEEISYATADGGLIVGNIYGDGQHAVLLAHGAIFDKESWHDFALILSARGYKVLAIDFRGYGQSTRGNAENALFQDVVAGIRYLRDVGAQRVSVIGASMGGGAVAQASTVVQADELDKLILLAAVPISSPERIQGDKLFIVSQGDSLRESVESQFERAGGPKELTVLSGSAHAQHIFKSRRRGEELTDTILAWLGGD
jgi:pimeloyl-ACP methyl ester carboxylesterase